MKSYKYLLMTIALVLAFSITISIIGFAAPARHESAGGVFAQTDLNATEVDVEPFKGVVQTSGFVAGLAANDRAVEVARGVSGAASVKNNLGLN